MIETLIECLQPYQELKVTFRRTKRGILVSMFSLSDCVGEVFHETDSKEYIRLTLFDMLDYLGYTPPRVDAVDDFV